MKLKFADYEAQSEKYYAEMLEKFKEQARKVVNKKQRELDALTKLKNNQEARIVRLKERTTERAIKNFWSDESEESEEEAPLDFFKRQVDYEEYDYVRKDRKRAKLAVTKWVKRFREEFNRNPTDADTQPVAMELADYNHVNMQYMEIKMAMIKQEKMPFEADSFFNPEKAAAGRPGSRAMGGRKQTFKEKTDQFMNTLSKGFGAAGSSNNRNNNSMLEGTGSLAGTQGVNYFEIRCKEL